MDEANEAATTPRVNARLLAGIGWTTVSRLFSLMLQLASSAVVGRHLAASDIGVVGFANIVTGFLGRFMSLGMDVATIQRKQLDDRILGTAFSIQAAFGVTACLACLSIAPLSQQLIGHDGAAAVLMVLSTIFLVNVLGFVPTCLLTRDLQYGRLSFAHAARALSRGILIISLVLLGFGYWGIVIADVAAAAIFVLSLGRGHPWIVRARFDRSVARVLTDFGGPIVATNLIVFLLFNADNFAIGTVLGATMLGYYAVAFSWASMICGLLYEAVNSVLFPAFCRIQENAAEMKRLYLRTVERVGFVAVAVNTCLLTSAHEFLVVVLGQGSGKWLPAVTCMQVLAIYGMLRAMTEPMANVMFALRETKTLLKANVFGAVIELSLMVPALLWYGINGVAILVTIAYVAQLCVSLPLLIRRLSLRVSELLAIVVPLAIASTVCFGGTLLIAPTSLQPSWVSLGVRLFVTGAALTLLHGMLTSFRLLKEAFKMLAEPRAELAEI
jgi:lipopolysaccharide exporter